MWATCPVSINLVPSPPCNRTSFTFLMIIFIYLNVLSYLCPPCYSCCYLTLWLDNMILFFFPVILSSLAIAICSQALWQNSASIKCFPRTLHPTFLWPGLRYYHLTTMNCLLFHKSCHISTCATLTSYSFCVNWMFALLPCT